MLRVGRALRVIPLSFVFIPLACDDAPSIGDVLDSSAPEVDAGVLADVGLDTRFGEDGSEESCPVHCSSDMHTVLDCKGEPVRTCSDEQGCNPDTGDCVAACESSALNKGSVGCEFYTTTRVLGCFAAFVANVWTKPVKIEVDIEGAKAKLDDFARIPSGTGQSTTYVPLPGGLLPAGQIAILFLGDLNPAYPQCPAGVAAAEAPMKTGTAIHITTDYPVAVHDIVPYASSSTARASATLLFPTSTWGDNYIAVDPWANAGPFEPYYYTLQLIAREDATEVTVLPAADVRDAISGKVKPKGVPFTATLNKGAPLTLWSSGLAGSVIGATKPVGVWTAGNLEIDEGYCCQDDAHQQIPPVPTLGSEYVGVRYRNRYEGIEESPPWRILGIVDDTTLTYEPAAPPGAPTEIKAGQLATFYAPGPFVVRSQDSAHPIYVSAHMTGCGYAGPSPYEDCRGDPEFVNVPPATRFLSSYTFFTDLGYPETDLVVVRARGKGGFEDVVLDCAGPLTGWQPVGTSYEYTRVALSRGNFVPQVYAGGPCENGRHEIKSDAPFGITVWGWGTDATNTPAVSYAYPGGQAVRPVNTIKVPPVPK
jgi:hypothetical protein